MTTSIEQRRERMIAGVVVIGALLIAAMLAFWS
jgi:hypothetical protein